MGVPVVHLITDRRLQPDLRGRAAAALVGLPPARVLVQLREKDLPGRELLRVARALAVACHEAGQRLVVNDRVDVAVAAGADGVHLPAAGIPVEDARRLLGDEALVGVSCHSAAEVRRAREAGASYATVSPIYDTPSKRAYGAPVGLAVLREAAASGLPVIALGGITAARVPEVLAAGARGVGAIRAWLEAADPAAAVRALLPPAGS
jgi:thiamine-phosphate pyrophosphorylase